MYILPEDRPYYSNFHDAWFFYDIYETSIGPFKREKVAIQAQEIYGRWITDSLTFWDKVLIWLANTKSAASK